MIVFSLRSLCGRYKIVKFGQIKRQSQFQVVASVVIASASNPDTDDVIYVQIGNLMKSAKGIGPVVTNPW